MKELCRKCENFIKGTLSGDGQIIDDRCNLDFVSYMGESCLCPCIHRTSLVRDCFNALPTENDSIAKHNSNAHLYEENKELKRELYILKSGKENDVERVNIKDFNHLRNDRDRLKDANLLMFAQIEKKDFEICFLNNRIDALQKAGCADNGLLIDKLNKK